MPEPGPRPPQRRLRLHLGGVPIHPALVHFPIALWSGAPLAQSAWLMLGHSWLWTLAYWLILLGLVLGALAAVAGLADLSDSRRFPRDSASFALASTHMRWMAASWSCFAVQTALVQPQPPGTMLAMIALGLSAAGFAAMARGAHQAGRLVYGSHSQLALEQPRASARSTTPDA